MNRNRRIVVVVLVVGAVAAWLVLADTNHDNADTATGDTIVPNDEMTHSDEGSPHSLAVSGSIDEQTRIPTIYALGDSLTAGYRLPLEKSYPMQLEKLLRDAGYEYAVINGGSSGDTSAGLVSRVDRVTQDAQPGDIALIVIGANDGMRSLSIDQLADNLTTLITTLQDRDITIVLGGMQVPTNLDPVYRESFAGLYPTIASETDVELLPFFLQDVAAVPELNLADGIHPNSTGYAIIAQNMMDTLIQAQIVSQ